eukprot:Transcript_19252.p2 GENE.Transcript_19252~~Transcript_19252.p2  ORF type:complete len:203 (-),score=42.55 Transcript_19252:108-716(-)
MEWAMIVAQGAAAATTAFTAAAAAPCATIIAHSMGTAHLASLLRARPALARAALFLDPVCFLLYRRDVVHSFLYRQPTLRRSWWRPSRWFRLGLHRLITREPGIQSCFRRDFWWAQHLLHPEDVPCRAAVLLAARDAIVPARAVAHHCRGAPLSRRLRVEVHEGCEHGWLVLRPSARRGALEALRALRGAELSSFTTSDRTP